MKKLILALGISVLGVGSALLIGASDPSDIVARLQKKEAERAAFVDELQQATAEKNTHKVKQLLLQDALGALKKRDSVLHTNVQELLAAEKTGSVGRDSIPYDTLQEYWAQECDAGE